MIDVERLKTYLLPSHHRVVWVDELAEELPNHRPHATMVNVSKVRGNKRHFRNVAGRIGATREGCRLISGEWSEEDREAVDKLFSTARSSVRSETQAKRRVEAEQQQANEPTEENQQDEVVMEDEYPHAGPASEPEQHQESPDNGALMIPERFRRINAICKATKGQIGGRDVLVVDARDLYEGLGVKGTEFRHWLKRRVTENSEFKEGVDYEVIDAKEFRSKLTETSAGGRPPRNARLTIETAKRISMAEGGDVGKLVRSYYLWTEGVVEEVVTQQADNAITPAILAAISAAVSAAVSTAMAPFMVEFREHRRASSSGGRRPSDFGFEPPPQPVSTRKRGQTSLRPFVSEAKRWLKIRMPIQQILAFVEERLVAQQWAERGAPPNAYTRGNLLATPAGYESGYVVNFQASRPSDGVVFPMALNLTKEGSDYCLDILRAEFMTTNSDDRQSDFFQS